MDSMRALFTVVFLFGLTRQADADNGCTNPTIKMVSQTTKGFSTMTMHMGPTVVQNTSVPPQDINAQQKIDMSFDYDKFNFVVAMTQSFTVAGKNISQEINEILNWDAGTLTVRMAQDGSPSPTTPECTTMKLPTWLPIKSVMHMLFAASKGMYKCVSHHDGLDVFGFDFPPKFFHYLPLPMDMEMHLTIEADEAGLLKSERMKEKVKSKSMDMEMDMNMVFTESRLGGPSDDDLVVPESWGKCRTVEILKEEDLLPEWLGSKSPFVGHNRIIPHLIRAVLSGHKAEEEVLV